MLEYIIFASILAVAMPWIFPKLFGLPTREEFKANPEKYDYGPKDSDFPPEWPAEWRPKPRSPFAPLYHLLILALLALLAIQILIAFPQLAAWLPG
jgi:hypothetical protein